MPEPRYRYIVGHFNAQRQRDWVVNTEEAEDALSHFISSLVTVGHDERKVNFYTQQFTIAMMQGKDGMTVLDPGLLGETSITRIATN